MIIHYDQIELIGDIFIVAHSTINLNSSIRSQVMTNLLMRLTRQIRDVHFSLDNSH
jgi:hypothetical protein